MRFRIVLVKGSVVSLLFCNIAGAQVAPLPPGSRDTDASQVQTQESPLASIESAIEDKNYDKARTSLDAYISAHPTDARALFDRGYCDDAQGKTAQAKDYYRKAIAADPKQFEARLALGLILAKEGDPGAQEQLLAAAKLDPNPPSASAKGEALRALARLVRNSDPDTAKQALIDALKITPETTEDMLLAAQIAEAEGDSDLAEQGYRRVLNADHQSSAATAGLTHLLLQQKKYAEAEPLLKAALVRDPNDPALNAQYASLLVAEGKSDEGVAVLEKLHHADPGDQAVGRMLADGYAQSGQTDKADAVYAGLLASDPSNSDLEAARGQVLIREGEYDQALVLLQNAAKSRQNDPDVWAGIAFAASKTHRPDLVLDALTMRSKIAPETPATYFLWATACDNLHRNKQALEYYQLFLKSAAGGFPDEAWQAKQRIAVLMK